MKSTSWFAQALIALLLVAAGAVLWRFDLPAASEGVPAVYQVNGRQYLAIAVGGNGLFSQQLGLPEPGPGQYMVFALPQ